MFLSCISSSCLKESDPKNSKGSKDYNADTAIDIFKDKLFRELDRKIGDEVSLGNLNFTIWFNITTLDKYKHDAHKRYVNEYCHLKSTSNSKMVPVDHKYKFKPRDLFGDPESYSEIGVYIEIREHDTVKFLDYRSDPGNIVLDAIIEK
jgi:hypothetical protein